MARPLRLEFSGAIYHITSRGNRREDIFENDSDRTRFLTLLNDVCNTHNWVCHAYCLMGNHYHLLIETPDANLSKGMRQLNGVYTQTFNRAHGRVGHIFQGRFKAILVEKENYLLELSRYIVLNPVRAGMVRSAADWAWSSYRATVGRSNGPDCLHTEWILAAFGKRKSLAMEKFRRFVSEGKGQPSPWKLLRNQVYLGGENFVQKMQSMIAGDRELGVVPAAHRRPMPKTLDYYYAASNQDRNSAIALAYRSGGYTLREIGDHFGLHYSTVSGIIKNHNLKT
ncbi:MAG: transposase [Gammaproteobacteria bacterium]|nr:transposase [Gammaproteobacteria bacterium]